MTFGNSSLALHLLRGAIGFIALAASLATVNQSWWPTLVLIPVASWMLKGCPVCWTVGLFETLANKLHTRIDKLSPDEP
jgi:hypothetical protein